MQWELDWCKENYTGAKRTRLVQLDLDWCSWNETGAVRTRSVQCELHWCKENCTGAGRSRLVQRELHCERWKVQRWWSDKWNMLRQRWLMKMRYHLASQEVNRNIFLRNSYCDLLVIYGECRCTLCQSRSYRLHGITLQHVDRMKFRICLAAMGINWNLGDCTFHGFCYKLAVIFLA